MKQKNIAYKSDPKGHRWQRECKSSASHLALWYDGISNLWFAGLFYASVTELMDHRTAWFEELVANGREGLANLAHLLGKERCWGKKVPVLALLGEGLHYTVIELGQCQEGFKRPGPAFLASAT